MRRLALIVSIVAGVAIAIACDDKQLPPQGQIVLYLDTDAPLAPATTSPTGPGDPVPPLFDRVLVELFEPNATVPCPDCRREIVVDAALMKDRRFSFGFVPRPRVVGYRARLVLYRAVAGLAPRPNAAIELVGYLPAVAEDGIKEMTARFRTDDLGKPRGSMTAPIIFDVGRPEASAVGSWPGAQLIPCGEGPPSAAPAAVCVPGGAFWMGDPRVTLEGAEVGGAREHIAVVPPFFLDAHEVTVADVRASKLAKLDSRGKATDPVDDLSDEDFGQCDYSAASGPNEALPVTCISWELASAYCHAKGGDLPSEAEIEIAASSRGTKLTPWGDRDPICGEAAIAGCRDAGQFTIGSRVLPLAPGSGTLDRVKPSANENESESENEIVDLGANLAEWTRDVFQTDEGPCWSGANTSILNAPACPPTLDPANKNRSAKSGDLRSVPARFVQTRRSFDATFPTYATVGFRCSYLSK